MSAYGTVKSVSPIMIKNVSGRSKYEVMTHYQQKLRQLTAIQQYQLLNSLDENSRYLLFQVMNYKP